MGMFAAQRREEVFGLLAGDLEVKRVWIKIYTVFPDELARGTDTNLLKSIYIPPCSEHAFSNKVGKIRNT